MCVYIITLVSEKYYFPDSLLLEKHFTELSSDVSVLVLNNLLHREQSSRHLQVIIYLKSYHV